MSYALRFNPDGTSGGDVVTLPNSVIFNSGTTDWAIEFSVAFDSYPTTGNWYIIGSNTATAAGFCLRKASGNGVLALTSGGTNQASASSPVGFILADGLQHKYRVVRVSGTSISFYRDDAPVLENKAWVTSSIFTLALNRFGAGSTTATVFTPMVLSWFDATATVSANGQRWESDLSGGTGDIWPTVSGSNQGTLVNFTTVDADKWINYGGGPIALDSALQAFSSLTADLTAQIQLAAQFTGVSSITASLQTGAVTGANLGAVATITAVLTTGIRLNSSMSNTSSISGVLSDAAPELPPQFIPVINSITPYSNSAVVNYSYSGSDATSYKGRINGGAPFTLSVSPAIIVGLAPETTYALEIAAENSVGLGAWSAPTNFTTVAAGSSDELIIRNIVRPYIRPVLKEIKK